MPRGLFVTAAGTHHGKTFVGVGLARALVRAGHRVVAVKPVESGVADVPHDAVALAGAVAEPDLAHVIGFHRAERPLSPYACHLEGEPLAPSVEALASACVGCARRGAALLVEGAGGLLTPLDAATDMADLARALHMPLLVVAPDRLGVLSDTLSLAIVAQHRGLEIAAVVLTRASAQPDASARTNERVLGERLGGVPVLVFPHVGDGDLDARADAAEECGLLDLARARLAG